MKRKFGQLFNSTERRSRFREQKMFSREAKDTSEGEHKFNFRCGVHLPTVYINYSHHIAVVYLYIDPRANNALQWVSVLTADKVHLFAFHVRLSTFFSHPSPN